jgi:hypothetical protein
VGLLQDRAEFLVPLDGRPSVRRVQDEAREAIEKLQDAKAG